jgi:DNA mismatch repair protein MutL
LLDRRAAHERIWFDRLVAQFDSGAVPSQRMLLPIPLELDPIAAALLIDRTKFLGNHGFEIGEFGRNFFRIEAVPTWMEPADAEPFVRDVLGALRDGRLPESNLALARGSGFTRSCGRVVCDAHPADEPVWPPYLHRVESWRVGAALSEITGSVARN